MPVRPPSDAAVTLRSLPRRFRSLFTGLGDDESPEALAVRPAPDGTTALGHLCAAIRSVTTGGQSLAELQRSEDAVVADPQAGRGSPSGTVDERLAELGWEADALADRIEGIGADAWGARGTLTTTAQTITALELVWLAVDTAIADLKAAERTLDAVRRQRP